MTSAITIPNRYESLVQTFGNEVRPLIVPVDADLGVLLRLREQARVQAGGVVVFLLGASGVGKTTTVHAASVHHPQDFAPVCSVPPTIRLRDVAGWLQSHLPAIVEGVTVPVLFDGREVSDDDVGLKQFLTALNQILRLRSDVVFFWPTTDSEWHRSIREMARSIGGSNLVPDGADHSVVGPDKKDWATALDRLLLQFGKTVDDVGLAADVVGQLVGKTSTIGAFLTEISSLVAERVTKQRLSKRLPRLVVCVSSSADVAGEANRIRRAGTQALAAEPLLGYSPRSEAGKWWAERNKSPLHHLGYMLSLFDARLVTMTASAVVHSILQHGAPDLKKHTTDAGARLDKGNAGRTIRASEVVRFFRGEEIPEFTSGKKGKTSEATEKAFAAVQAVSVNRHKAINEAIIRMVATAVATPDLEQSRFEVSHDQNVITDVVIPSGADDICFEFHHLSGANCKAATMSSYIMDKVRGYAWHHNLIPR